MSDTTKPCEHDGLGCGGREPHDEHTKVGDGRPCCGWPPQCTEPAPRPCEPGCVAVGDHRDFGCIVLNAAHFAEPDAGNVEALAKVLAEHELLSGNTATRHKRRFAGSFVCRCGHVEREVDNVGYQDLHSRHLATALLRSDWLDAREAAAEQRGREDNADHGMCYVHGSKALAATDAAARAEERRVAVAALIMTGRHTTETANAALDQHAARIVRESR